MKGSWTILFSFVDLLSQFPCFQCNIHHRNRCQDLHTTIPPSATRIDSPDRQQALSKVSFNIHEQIGANLKEQATGKYNQFLMSIHSVKNIGRLFGEENIRFCASNLRKFYFHFDCTLKNTIYIKGLPEVLQKPIPWSSKRSNESKSFGFTQPTITRLIRRTNDAQHIGTSHSSRQSRQRHIGSIEC